MRTHPYSPGALILLLAVVIIMMAMTGCATTPKGTTQTIYAAGWTLVGATNSVADLHDAGKLKGADYDKAKEILGQATVAYKQAESLAVAGKTADAQASIQAAQSILNQLALYLASKGVK
jgi:hypothetical protein